METRNFYNPRNLTKPVILLRLRSLDPLAEADPRDGVYTHDEQGAITGQVHYVIVISTLTDEQIEAALSTPQTAEETATINAYLSAASGFMSLPNWATWTQSDFETWCNTNLQTDAQIDGMAISAGLKANLKANNAFTRNGGKAILFLRDYIIRIRR